MPLKKGSSKKVISKNIKEMERSETFAKGKSQKKKHEMAVAAAMHKAKPKGMMY